MANFISEDDIEQALLQSLQHRYGFDVLDCYTNKPEDLTDGSNRQDKRDVILTDRLREACLRLNAGIPPAAIDDAIEEVADRRAAMAPIQANMALDDDS